MDIEPILNNKYFNIFVSVGLVTMVAYQIWSISSTECTSNIASFVGNMLSFVLFIFVFIRFFYDSKDKSILLVVLLLGSIITGFLKEMIFRTCEMSTINYQMNTIVNLLMYIGILVFYYVTYKDKMFQ